MKTILTLALILAGGALAVAQDERDRRVEELRRDHDRRIQELQRKFDEDRGRLDSEFRRRVEDLRRPEPGQGERRPGGGSGVEEQIRRLAEQVERLTREVERLKNGDRPSLERAPEFRRAEPPRGPERPPELRRPEPPRSPERPPESRRPDAPRNPERPQEQRPPPGREPRREDRDNPEKKRDGDGAVLF
jgi:hypothetical protein